MKIFDHTDIYSEKNTLLNKAITDTKYSLTN